MSPLDSIKTCLVNYVIDVGTDLKLVPIPINPTRDGHQNNSIVFDVNIFILFIKVFWFCLGFVPSRPPPDAFNKLQNSGLKKPKEKVGISDRLGYCKAVNNTGNSTWIKKHHLDQKTSIQLLRIYILKYDLAASVKRAGYAIR